MTIGSNKTPTVIHVTTTEQESDQSSNSFDEGMRNRHQGSKSEFNQRRPPPLTINHEQIEPADEESIQELQVDSDEQYEVSIIPIEQERDDNQPSARRRVRVIQKSMSMIENKT